ncbi:hypothetical protein WJX73_008069 [Symbiochloris irregularis]|uniref:Uncharacterized protein n=1 Tax=Symbiochloris irregularis TaxID=706552 RepID=A0AAW1NYA3_9CHLO
MHPSNIHNTVLDFRVLAQSYPALLPYVVDKPGQDSSYDFTSSDAARELTKALLHQGYGIDWWIPAGQLIPPVPNRANYIHWIQDLLQLSSPAGQEGVKGMDIGCDFTKGIITTAMHPNEALTFTMCNPPFFDTLDEAGLNPATAFGGTEAEMVCSGGEDAFVRQMVRDSLDLQVRVHWYTTMGRTAAPTANTALQQALNILHSQGTCSFRQPPAGIVGGCTGGSGLQLQR